MKNINFFDLKAKVFALTEQIPKGKITTYKIIASSLGNVFLSRNVGKILKNCECKNNFLKNYSFYECDKYCYRVIKSNFNVGKLLLKSKNEKNWINFFLLKIKKLESEKIYFDQKGFLIKNKLINNQVIFQKFNIKNEINLKLDKFFFETNGVNLAKRLLNKILVRRINNQNYRNSEIWIENNIKLSKNEIIITKRINIDYAKKYKNKLWRFYIKNNPFVSLK